MPNNSPRSTRRTRILIADDYLPFAERCRVILEPEFAVVGVVADGYKLTKTVAALKPDVVVIDMSMPELNGFEAGEKVKATKPDTKTIYMTLASGFDEAFEAFQRGASAYVIKRGFPEELRVAVRRAVRGELHLSFSLLENGQAGGSYHIAPGFRPHPVRERALAGNGELVA
jgi:DNA-binding NarL/FixJ family response regulator